MGIRLEDKKKNGNLYFETRENEMPSQEGPLTRWDLFGGDRIVQLGPVDAFPQTVRFSDGRLP